MGKRVLQLVAIALAGALMVWWQRREPQAAPPAATSIARERMPVSTVAASLPPAETPPTPIAQPRPAGLAAPAAAPALTPSEAAPPPGSFEVPKDWLLRGSNAKSYELRTDLTNALSGNASAVLMSHDTEVQPNLVGSALQAVQAAPYLGLRMELTAATRGEGWGTTGEVWLYTVDPAGVVLTFQNLLVRPESVPRTRTQWRRHRIVMDVPTHADTVVFGFSVRGRGKLWADDFQLTAVDKSIPLTSGYTADPVGVVAQATSSEGALAKPSNLDFEYFAVTRERQAPAPRDAINATRF